MVTAGVSGERLLAVIELQNAIAAAGMNADEVMALVTERAGTLIGGAGAVAVVEGDELAYRAVARPSTISVGMRRPKTASVPGKVIADRLPIRIVDAAADLGIDSQTLARIGSGSLLCVPLLYGESPVGVLEVVSSDARQFSDEDVETMRLLAQIIAIALHRAYTYPKPRYDVATDALTGLGNRRAYDERINAELARLRRFGHSFSLALLDLDGLEAAIDRLGQARGDEALRSVSAIVRKNTRAIDAGFRVAAHDFAIVMPGTSIAGARIVAERFRSQIGEARLCDATVSAAIGLVEAKVESADELAARAAAALSADKQSHR